MNPLGLTPIWCVADTVLTALDAADHETVAGEEVE